MNMTDIINTGIINRY